MNKISIPKYSLSEEIINSITHGIGSLLSIFALIILIIKASNVSMLATISTIIFGTSMVCLYTISCIYHALSPKIIAKKVLRVLDHCNVFMLVFGTIIPVSLLGIRGVWGWIFLSIVLVTTTTGIIFTAINVDKYIKVSLICHLLNGWSVLIFSYFLFKNIGLIGLLLIIIGGIMYSIGSCLYIIGSRVKYIHSLFHLFCLFGTFFHFLSIYFYIL